MCREVLVTEFTPELITKNLIITILEPKDYQLLATYERANRAHLAKWEPLRSDEYFTDEAVRKRVAQNFDNFKSGSSIAFVALDKKRTKIICCCNYSNIVQGVFQACHLGYSVNMADQGKGLMFEMLQASLEYVFSQRELHRVMANYITSNIRSDRLLARLGFEKEGVAKSYLKIAGSWQDHVLTSKINPNHVAM
ncbi:GNAT family N-acetyltransferase [Colwellia sp. D2M02]|nr:GNAT family N-acetyltransferase [Colwellia sp. D2M02]MBU2894866.1 GNAT family N-acetyltransferase [Colwellia sp. D2M02]